MPTFTIEFRGCADRVEEDFRDLAMAKSEAMRRAADIAEIDDRRGDDALGGARLFDAEGRMLHQVRLRDLAEAPSVAPEYQPEETNDELEEGLQDSFPASDPPSVTSAGIASADK